MLPTQRTLKQLRKDGYMAQVVERWIPQARRRIDLFGIVDIIAIKPREVLGVQATTASNIAAHVTKATVEMGDNLLAWLMSGARFEIWGYSKKGPRGEAKHWQVSKRIFMLIGSNIEVKSC